MKGHVYKLTAPDGRVYIGRTIDFKRRMRQYQSPSRMNSGQIYKDILELGFDNFKKEILETVEGEEETVIKELNRLEALYIEKYDSVNTGYNSYRIDARTCTAKLSDKTKEKMRKSQIGRKHSEESRKKRSGENAYQGKGVESEMLGKKFATLKEAADYVGICGGCKISEFINGKRKSAGKHPITHEPINDWKYSS